LGDTYTDETKVLMESVRDYPITIAISANATGKTFTAASVAIWWFRAFQESQVYTAAAPPESNLKKLLWGEIGTRIEKHPDLFSSDIFTTLHLQRSAQSFLTGVTIPSSGTEAQKEAKFCADADELFELKTGELVPYKSLIGKVVDVVSICPDFKKEPATAEFFNNGMQPVYEITLSSGMVLVRTGRHPFYIGRVGQSFKTHGGKHIKGRYLVKDEKWVNVEDIKTGAAVLIPEDTSFNFGNLSMDVNEIKVLAYLIGDGYIGGKSSILFIQEDNKQLAEFKDVVHALGSTIKVSNPKEYSWRVNGDGTGKTGSNPVCELLKKHGIWGNKSATKHIPADIFKLNATDIALFLNRLYSTDGWACVSKTGKYQKSEIGYLSKSEQLIRDIQRLLFRFGIHPTIRRQRKSWTYKGIKKYDYYWTCSIARADNVLRFAEQIGIYGKEKAIKMCIEFSSNTTQPKATWRKSRHDGFLWDRIRSIELVGVKPTVGLHVPGNNTYLTNVVEHNSGKHSPHLLFILDEGDAIPDSVFQGIESCMTGGHARLLVMFNPRAEIGEAYRMQRDGRANVVRLSAFNHPNVISGDDKIPGAVSRNVTVRRINEWCRPLVEGQEEPDAECFELPDFLAGQTAKSHSGKTYPALKAGHYKVMEPAFSYMVLGRYPSQSTRQLISKDWIAKARTRYPSQSTRQLISKDWIAKARTRWDVYVAEHGETPPAYTSGVMGQDVAEFGSDSNVLCKRYGGYVERFVSWQGMDVISSADRGVIEAKEKGLRVNVDATGVGAGVAPHMQKSGCSATGVKVASKPTERTELGEFYILRDQLWWAAREWLRSGDGSMLPPDEGLVEELAVPTYEIQNGKIRVMKKDTMKELLKRSPDKADALCLTFYEGGFFTGCDFS